MDKKTEVNAFLIAVILFIVALVLLVCLCTFISKVE